MASKHDYVEEDLDRFPTQMLSIKNQEDDRVESLEDEDMSTQLNNEMRMKD